MPESKSFPALISAISKDLRRQIHRMIMDDKSDIEITNYMVDRYGDFILYRPQFNGQTAVLWLSPVALLLLGLLVWWRMASGRKRSKSTVDPSLTVAEQQRLNELLGDDTSGERVGGPNSDKFIHWVWLFAVDSRYICAVIHA